MRLVGYYLPTRARCPLVCLLLARLVEFIGHVDTAAAAPVAVRRDNADLRRAYPPLREPLAANAVYGALEVTAMRREARGLRPPATAATAAVALVVLLAVYVAPASRWDMFM